MVPRTYEYVSTGKTEYSLTAKKNGSFFLIKYTFVYVTNSWSKVVLEKLTGNS